MAKLLSGTRIYGNTTVDTQLFVNGSNASTSNTTGALIVTGGVGVSGNVYAGNVISLGFYQFADNTRQYTANVGLETAVASFNQANLAFNKANSANILAQAAFDAANSTPLTNSFSTIAVDGQDDLVANSTNNTLTLFAGSGIAITTIEESNRITISAIPTGSSLFADGSDFGETDEETTQSSDLGLVTEETVISLDLGLLVIGGIIQPTQFIAPSYTVATLPNPNPAAQLIFVADESGGSVMAFSDGTNWRRMTDRAIVT